MLAYTQEQARESIRNIAGKPKAVILHVGTNDIKNNIDADQIISNHEDLIKLIHNKLPKTQSYSQQYFTEGGLSFVSTKC